MYSYVQGPLRMDKSGDFIECDITNCETVAGVVIIDQTSGGFGACVVKLQANVLMSGKIGFTDLIALTMADPTGSAAAQTCKGYTRARLTVTTTGTTGGTMLAAICGYSPLNGPDRSVIIPTTMGI